MNAPLIGARVTRKEDYRFLTGAGQYTDDVGTVLDLPNRAYVNLGPGIRVMFCDRADIGLGAAFGVTDNHGPAQLYRTEFRFRF